LLLRRPLLRRDLRDGRVGEGPVAGPHHGLPVGPTIVAGRVPLAGSALRRARSEAVGRVARVALRRACISATTSRGSNRVAVVSGFRNPRTIATALGPRGMTRLWPRHEFLCLAGRYSQH